MFSSSSFIVAVSFLMSLIRSSYFSFSSYLPKCHSFFSLHVYLSLLFIHPPFPFILLYSNLSPFQTFITVPPFHLYLYLLLTSISIFLAFLFDFSAVIEQCFCHSRLWRRRQRPDFLITLYHCTLRTTVGGCLFTSHESQLPLIRHKIDPFATRSPLSDN
jgi:hypothetical protein